MPSIIKPLEVFEKGIQDAIKKRTGKILSIKELEMLDSKKIGQLAGINRMKIRIIPGFLSKIVCLKRTAYNRAVVNGLLMKKNYL